MRSSLCIICLAMLIFGFGFNVQLFAQTPDSTAENAREAAAAESPEKLATDKKIPPPLTNYLGREIARTMSHHAADWLTRDARENEERCSMMLSNLGLRRGDSVCDLGCGNGFHTLQIAKLIGDKGQVLAVDIQPEMLKLLRERTEQQGIENVIPILGSFHNPRLPKDSVDLILMVDVYHELSHPVQMLTAMKSSLKKDGLIVLIEFRAEDDSVPIKRLHKMSKDQINKEMQANGLELVKEFDRLPWQHMMFFGKKPTAESQQ